jgi:ferritin
MIDDQVTAALNHQINKEIYSAYLYVAMVAYFEARSLGGFSSWMQVQVREELSHAEKMFRYLVERGGALRLDAIDAPPSQWVSPLSVFESALHHETVVTKSINDLMDVALAARDHATAQFLQWFVGEQVEEEASFDAVVQQLRLAGDNGAAIMMLDRELATRVFTPPAAGPGA